MTAEEEVSKLIESISDNASIRDRLMQVSNTNRLTVIRELGLLQRDHPGIAISVKTKAAVRSILNQVQIFNMWIYTRLALFFVLSTT